MTTMHTSNRISGDRSIGAILIDSGKLTLDKAERIMRLQKDEGLRFGDAAIKLGLLNESDIAYALARQYDYPYLLKGDSKVSDDLIAAFQPFSPQVEALRALRSQLMLRWFTGEPERKALTIASPGRGDGRSWLAANLAVVFSQLGENTLLIDADMRNPSQHDLFKLENRSGLSTLLSGRGDAADVKRIPSFMGLSVLPAGPVPPNPQELLGRPQFAVLLDQLRGQFDSIIIDTSAATEYADAQTVAVRAGGALLLAHKHQTSLDALGSLTENLRQLGVQPVGSVISEF
jgi:protein-tyrosine kinase